MDTQENVPRMVAHDERQKVFLLITVSTLVALLIVEVGFRVLVHLDNRGILSATTLEPSVEIPDDGTAKLGHLIRLSTNRRIVYELKPGISTVFNGVPVTINEQGFRGPGYSISKPPGTYRIVGLGDSVLFGWGVREEEAFLWRLEEQLRRARPEQRWEVINTGVPGYNTSMEVETLASRMLAYSPDLVLLDFVGNDFELPNFIREPVPVLTLRRSFLWEFLESLLLPIQRSQHGLAGRLVAAPLASNGRRFASNPRQAPPEYRDMVGWRGYASALRRLAELQRREGFQVLWHTYTPDATPRIGRSIQLARDLGFHVVDLGPVLQARLKREGYGRFATSPLAYTETDPHPSALTHSIAGDVLTQYMLASVLPSKDTPTGEFVP